MELSALEIAYIAGGFAILGTLVGSITTYFLSKDLTRRTEHNQAVKEFISAFHEELMRIKLDCPAVPLRDIIEPARIKHATACAIFRRYLTGCELTKFDEAFRKYYVNTPPCPSKEQDSEKDIDILIEKIETLLEFAKNK